MAGLSALKILLLWAGMIGFGKCQTEKATPASSISSNQTSSPNQISNSVSATQATPSGLEPSSSPPTTNRNSSLVSVTSPTTITAATAAVTTAHKPPLNLSTLAPVSESCFYTVDSIQYGFQINILDSPTGMYNITLNEEGQQIEKSTPSSVNHTSPNSSHIQIQLKPCTKYEHHVSFFKAGKEISCNSTGTATSTNTVAEKDIKEVNTCTIGHLCYETGWNVKSFSSEPGFSYCLPSRQNIYCVKPSLDDICSNFTINWRSQTCHSTFPFYKLITLDFLNPSDINQMIPTSIPATIDAKLPPKCEDVSIEYKCREPGRGNWSQALKELEPYKNYECIGHIRQYNKTIKETPPLNFTVKCEITIKINHMPSAESVHLSWNTIIRNCEDNERFSYSCSCKQPGQELPGQLRSGQKDCTISGLKPFTTYTCSVQPKYNGREIPTRTEVNGTTLAGYPDKVKNVQLHLTAHNVITVNCGSPQEQNGPRLEYIVKLSTPYGSEIKTLQSRTCLFMFDNLGYLTTYTVQVTAFNGFHKSSPVTETVSTSYNDKAVIGFLIFLILLVSVALLVVFYKIVVLKRRKSHDMNEHMELIQPANDEENLLPVEPIPAEVLLEAYKRKLADEGRLFLEEFQSIPRIFSRHTVKDAKKTCNGPKNRYVDILPYDYNRVQLTTGSGEAGSDYINASFIDGYKEPKKYIAAQGPKDETVGDFWRMIWEQQTSIIVMVTQCEEGNRIKCAQYWPSPQRETEIFKEFVVNLKSEDHFPDYIIRRLSVINKKEKSSEREVTHIQFKSWPDHGVPEEPQLLLKLRRRVNAFKNLFSGPIVVHCSAGVGRTGTYTAIDAMMECLEAEGRVDIYGYVVQLRRQRCLMVQVEAQYILIHQALLEHNQFGETEIPVAELPSTLSTLREKNSESELTLMEEEYERLPSFKKWRTFNTGISEENEEKNRSLTVIPYDYNGVLLKLDEGCSHDSDQNVHNCEDDEDSSDEDDDECSKYINASYISGYWGQQVIIAAQTPLPNTIGDFWSMIYQKKVSTIVMLSDSSEKDEGSVYWEKKCEDIEVEVTNKETTAAVISRNMLLRHTKRLDSRSVRHLQFLQFGNKDLPERPQELIDMIKEIKKSGDRSKPQNIVVHCNDGSSRTGVFCALWNLLDSANTEKLVDVFQVVKTLRKERQNMIFKLEQYQFLYDAVQSTFPVQNGDVKATPVSAADSIQMMNETKGASTTTVSQQEAAPEAKRESSGPTETSDVEDSCNGPAVILEV
ncbi:receptor-type tyrosine-protein phosphatase C isoform X2 [Cynoglossus semilaevis]|uniref:receptor-type tyrosine-protein phosphatase C isoform X2 n=1 Tax=Cynoglossus semilaevis TaxID=244447 RepID=UPI0004971DF4|nr:receptor-type tyrosine-protein phosphatase C isoform X2 [Cynoglossus semilaevis]